MWTDGNDQMRTNATPGCEASPSTIFRNTDSTCCCDVTVTAKESNGPAVIESGARDGRCGNSSVHRIDSREAVGIDASRMQSFFVSFTISPPHKPEAGAFTPALIEESACPSDSAVHAGSAFTKRLSSFSTAAPFLGGCPWHEAANHFAVR
jgi:hypothetical protein